MKKYLLLAILLFLVRPAAAQDADSIVIIKSGSTNSAGYQATLSQDGTLTIAPEGEGSVSPVPAALAAQLFDDAGKAQPLSALAAGQCAKSVSFGTTTALLYHGEQSPDLSCPQDGTAQTLYDDILAVEKASGISALPRRLMVRQPASMQPVSFR